MDLRYACVFLALFPAFPSPSFADVCEFSAEAAAKFWLPVTAGCFGGEEDDAAVTKKLRESIDGLDKLSTDQELVRVGGGILDDINTALLVAKDRSWVEMKPFYDQLVAEVRAAARRLRDHGEKNAEMWEFESGSKSFPGLHIDPGSAYSGACPSTEERVAVEPPVHCEDAYDSLGGLVRYARLTQATLRRLVVRGEDFVAELERAAVVDRKWDAYFEQGRSQYIWELGLNSWRFKRKLKAQCGKAYEKEAKPGEDEQEFCERYTAARLPEPPATQWILFHPNAAVEIADDGRGDATSFGAVAVVELVGYNRLEWRDDSVVSWPLGVSIIATISPESRGQTLGWGGMIHINNTYSIGFARRDLGSGAETTWLVSVDLSELFLETQQKARRTFRRLH